MPSLTLWNETNTLWLVCSALYFLASMRHSIQVKRSAPLPSLERVCLVFAIALVFFPRIHLSLPRRALSSQPRHRSRGTHPHYPRPRLLRLGSRRPRPQLERPRHHSGRPSAHHCRSLRLRPPPALHRPADRLRLATTLVSRATTASLLGLFLAVSIFRLKARREEQLLEAEFGTGYAIYRAHTGGILPRIAHI